MAYDSTQDTQKHIGFVQAFLSDVMSELGDRSMFHDASKLQEPEKSMYDEYTPKLRELTYGSDEYKQTLKDMGAALQHHYEVNSHHPEHFKNGIEGMSLLDLIEMLTDWKAASMRHADGSIAQSMEVNKTRFGMSDQLAQIFLNTIKEMEW